MALICVSGDIGCKPEELACHLARKLNCKLITESTLAEMIAGEFGSEIAIPDKAWRDAVVAVLARQATVSHLALSALGAETLLPNFAGVLRVHLFSSTARAVGDLMLERRVDRTEARRLLDEAREKSLQLRTSRFGRAGGRSRDSDLTINCESFSTEQAISIVERAAEQRQLFDSGLLTAAAEAQIQFQVRLRLAKFGLAPSHRGRAPKREFGHPSEEIFANLLEFYRVRWEYEPRSFPLQWDRDGKVLEAFTPDFYLPEFDLYVELTTMKQKRVTKKNRKVRLLRAIYPHINIQVFYQKDLQDLVMKYGLADAVAK